MRAVPLPIHTALEAIAAPAVMIAPFVLGFGFAASVISITVGAVLLGLALQADGPGRAVPADPTACVAMGCWDSADANALMAPGRRSGGRPRSSPTP